MNYKIISQLLIIIFCSTSLISCSGQNSSNLEDALEGATIESNGGAEAGVTINGQTIDTNDDGEITIDGEAIDSDDDSE